MPLDRTDSNRKIRAPRGSELTCKSWLTEAPYRMIQNNLDPEVAEKPEQLIVYGGIGRAARNWESYDKILECLRELNKPAGAIGQAGRGVQDARRRAARAHRQFKPGTALGQLGTLQRARSQGIDDVRSDDRGIVDLHRQPGHRAGHLRNLRRGWAAAFRW